MLEFDFKYSTRDPVAYDMMVRNLDYVKGHYQLPLLWRNDAEKLPAGSREMALQHLKGLKRRLQHEKILQRNESCARLWLRGTRTGKSHYYQEQDMVHPAPPGCELQEA